MTPATSSMSPSAGRSGRCWMLLAALALSACTAGPDYVRPTLDTPAAYKEASNKNSGWKQAEPRDSELRGNWWEMYGDPVLNALAEQVSLANQTLAQAEARYRQAAALADGARSGYFPTIGANSSVTRSRASSNTNAQTGAAVSRGASTNYSLGFSASWELDLWGRVRRTAEAGEAGLEASAGDLEAARLLSQATLVQNYFQLRILDAQRQLLDDTMAGYKKSLQLTQNQYAAGVVAKADIIQATTQLKSTEAQALDIGVQRAQLEHAIAVLVGRVPAEFSLPPAPVPAGPPVIAPGLPSALLERRPDIAAAERRMAQANAQIGVAKAAWFPALTLSAASGFQAASFAQWLTAPSLFWSLGPALAMNLFDGGLRASQTAQAQAGYDANVAAYRQTVLTAFQEVENNLAALRVLEQEAAVQAEALAGARQVVTLTTNQYKAGTLNFLSVVTVQASALAAERAALDILARRMVASAALIKALGGGWSSDMLPAARAR